MTKGERASKRTNGDNNVVQPIDHVKAAPAAATAAGAVQSTDGEPLQATAGVLQVIAKSAGATVEAMINKIPETVTAPLRRWLKAKTRLAFTALLGGGLGLGFYGLSSKEATYTWVGVERGVVADAGKACSPRYNNAQIDALLKDPANYGQRRQTWSVRRDGPHFLGTATFQGSDTKHEVNGSVPRGPTDTNIQATGGLLAWMRSPEGEATYNLKPSKEDPTIFVGRQTAKDCDIGAVVSCAFLLAPEAKIAAAESMMAAIAKEPDGLCVRAPLL